MKFTLMNYVSKESQVLELDQDSIETIIELLRAELEASKERKEVVKEISILIE